MTQTVSNQRTAESGGTGIGSFFAESWREGGGEGKVPREGLSSQKAPNCRIISIQKHWRSLSTQISTMADAHAISRRL